MNGRTPVRRLLPGLAVLAGVAGLARLADGAVPALNALVLAVAAGVVLGNVLGVPDWARPGVDRHKLLLETGIVLLGARLTLGELVDTGPTVVALAAGAVVFGVFLVEVLGRVGFDLASGSRALLAAGASVCGVSAVLAVAGSLDVEEADVTYAVATILLFDAVTLVAFPVAGTLLGVDGKLFGVWAGLSLFSTGPTAAAGFAVSETAGQWATVTKLVRNTFIGAIAVGYAVRRAHAAAGRTDAVVLWYRFPKFLVGFLAVVAVVNAGVLSEPARASVVTTSDWLFTLAFVGLGIDVSVHRIREAGLRPVALVGVHLLVVSALSLLVLRALL
jgi:uncharacterized integral membrane protein (TIGR00698 family)